MQNEALKQQKAMQREGDDEIRRVAQTNASQDTNATAKEGADFCPADTISPLELQPHLDGNW